MVETLKKLFKKEKITKKYKNGDTYVGEMKNDKPHGYGTYTWPNGEKYVGVFKNDKKHGHGTWTLKDIKYVGEWKEDKMHGQGTVTSNEIKFIGKFKDGERVHGTQIWSSGDGEFAGNKYVGDYKDDKMHGQGSHTWADGNKYVGEWKEDKVDGRGTYIYPDGKYVGEWKNDKKHGQGTYTWENKDKYVGEWKDDKMCGQGTLTFADGHKYVGEVKNDVQHGQGTMLWADGDKYVGEWENGEQCGGTLTSADGKAEKITKKIKRNELAIFEELRLKIPTSLSNEAPPKSELKKIDNIYYYYNEKLKKNTYWQKTPTGRIVQVNQYGELVFSSNDEYQRNTPKKSLLKKYKTDVRFHRDEHIEDSVTWWAEDKNGELVQVNIKKGDAGVTFKIKSWLRDEAINHVGLEIRSLKNKAYKYSKEELLEMIEEEEGKIIRKHGWKWTKRAAMIYFGVGFLPGI